MRRLPFIAAVLLVLSGCTGGTPAPEAQASPTSLTVSVPTLAAPASPSALKYQLIAAFGGMSSEAGIFYCDPDEFPVGRPITEEQIALQVDEIQRNPEELQAILDQLGLAKLTTFSAEQKAAIYSEHKKLNAIQLQPAGQNFTFSLPIHQSQLIASDARVEGLITPVGEITIERHESMPMGCPICLAAETLIDTPSGPTLVTELEAGMLVWTLDAAGARIARPIMRVSATQVSSSHWVAHLHLADGREVWVSPGHPAADGRPVGDLKAGDSLDGSELVSVALVEYGAPATYDLLPAGPTGSYWANGILLDSTLR